METSKSTIIFFSIILIIGILTVITDLKLKKIYNNHLVIGAVLGLAAVIYTAVWAHENILFHFINGLIAFAAGLCCFRFGLWKGGDAKLFTLYAFLMPALERGHVLISSAINLFACSFLAGAIILIPFFIKDIASNYNAMIHKLSSAKELKDLVVTIGATIVFSWGLFPTYHFTIYYFAKIIPASLISLMITCIIFYLIRHFLKQMIINRTRINYIIAGSCIALGFLMRLWLAPNSLSWPILPYSIFKIGLFSALSACIDVTQNELKEYQDRIPFAPLLFMGCVLSYTPFLTWLMLLIRR